MADDTLKRLKDTVIGRNREVEVDEDGRVREVPPDGDALDDERPRKKATKLSARTFGALNR